MTSLQLAIQLFRDLETGQWYVNKIEAIRGIVTSKTSFSTPMPMTCVFRSEITAFIAAYLPVRLDPMVHSLDQRKFDRLDIVFSDVRFVAKRAFDGVQTVTVKVKRAVGKIFELYNADLQLDCNNWLKGKVEKLEVAQQ